MANSKGDARPPAVAQEKDALARATPLAEELIVVVRGAPVVLAHDLAAFYGATTGAVNQYRKRKEDRFTSDYAFQLTAEEWADLISRNVMSSGSHGGVRRRPWAYTEHGVAMMSMGMRGPEAVRLSKVIIETFVAFRRGALSSERVIVGARAQEQRSRLKAQIIERMSALLDAESPVRPGVRVREDLQTIAGRAVRHIEALLDKTTFENERLSADVTRIVAEAEKLYAEARKTHLEADGVELRNFKERLDVLRDLREMAAQLDRDDWVEVFETSFGRAGARLGAPDEGDDDAGAGGGS